MAFLLKKRNQGITLQVTRIDNKSGSVIFKELDVFIASHTGT